MVPHAAQRLLSPHVQWQMGRQRAGLVVNNPARPPTPLYVLGIPPLTLCYCTSIRQGTYPDS